MTPGLTKMKMLQIEPSISTGRTISGLSTGLNEEWTRVSSRSKTKVFLPMSWRR